MKNTRYVTLISNMFYFLLCTVTVKLIGYILLPVFTANMTTAEYGVADVLMSTVNLLYPIFALGLSGAVMRYAMDEKSDITLTFTSALKLLFISSFVAFLLVPFLQMFSSFSTYAIFVPVMIFLNNALALVSSLCKGVNQTKIIAVQNIVYGAVLFISAILLVKIFHLGVLGYLLSYCIACAVSLVIFIAGIKVHRYLDFRKERKEYRGYYIKLLRYGVPLVPNSLAWWIIQMSDRYMVAYWFGSAVNGLYAVAYKIPSIINAVVSIFMQAWQLTAISEYDKKDSIAFYNFIYRQYCVVCYIFSAVVVMFTRIFAKILFANEFFDAWKYVPLLLVAATIGSQQEYMGSYYLADNRTNRYFGTSVVGAVINIILNLILIPKFSVWGATVATVICYIIVYILRAADMKRNFGVEILAFKNFAAVVILFIQAITFVLAEQYRYLISLLCIVGMIVLFCQEIYQMLKIIRQKVLKRE